MHICVHHLTLQLCPVRSLAESIEAYHKRDDGFPGGCQSRLQHFMSACGLRETGLDRLLHHLRQHRRRPDEMISEHSGLAAIGVLGKGIHFVQTAHEDVACLRLVPRKGIAQVRLTNLANFRKAKSGPQT